MIGIAHPVWLESRREGRRFAARRRASHRAIGRVVLLFVAVSSRVQCGCIRTALRAAFGAAVNVRASCLERTRPAAIGALPADWLLVQQRRADDARSDSEGQRRKARQRTRHRAASACLHMGWRGTERLRPCRVGREARANAGMPRASHDRTRRSLRGAQP